MKKLALITLVFITSFAQAQEKLHSKQTMQEYTPEEISQVKAKQLTLDLDLTEEQQKQVQALYLENITARKAQMKQGNLSENKKMEKTELSKEDKLQMKNDRLDHQIATKKKMKEILNDEQYAKWEKLSEEKKEKQRKQMHQTKRASISKQK
ncbi:MAG TPA: hypothetical protein VKY41_02965 [Xanthomarina sp.]|nr:hypothetical protein [Xanthomarina sp.]